MWICAPDEPTVCRGVGNFASRPITRAKSWQGGIEVDQYLGFHWAISVGGRHLLPRARNIFYFQNLNGTHRVWYQLGTNPSITVTELLTSPLVESCSTLVLPYYESTLLTIHFAVYNKPSDNDSCEILWPSWNALISCIGKQQPEGTCSRYLRRSTV